MSKWQLQWGPPEVASEASQARGRQQRNPVPRFRFWPGHRPNPWSCDSASTMEAIDETQERVESCCVCCPSSPRGCGELSSLCILRWLNSGKEGPSCSQRLCPLPLSECASPWVVTGTARTANGSSAAAGGHQEPPSAWPPGLRLLEKDWQIFERLPGDGCALRLFVCCLTAT